MLTDVTPLANQAMLWAMIALPVLVFLMLFMGFAIYMRQRRLERENYYRFELRKKAIEAGVTADALLAMQRQEEQIVQRRGRENLKFSGILSIAAGLLLVAVAKQTGHADTLAMAFLPVVLGVAFYVYGQWFAPRGGSDHEPKPRS
jgi:peptidoglycan/LPS O-acetylase OafA/YrhL